MIAKKDKAKAAPWQVTVAVPFDEGRWSFNLHDLTEANNRFYGLGTVDMKASSHSSTRPPRKSTGASKPNH